LGFFQDLFTNDAAKDAANDKITGLNSGYKAASDLYGQGRDALATNYGAARDAYAPLLTLGQNGATAYGDATGANGSAGYARALDSFRTDPGYQFQFGQGLQAIDRGAAAKGMVTSGNTLNAEQQYGTGLADQSYGSYVSRLLPYLDQQTKASIVGSAGTANADTGLGTSLNSSFGNQGNLAYNTQTGIGDANAAADLARGAAANNVMSAIGQGVSLGTQLLGLGGFGGGGRTGFASGAPSLATGNAGPWINPDTLLGYK